MHRVRTFVVCLVLAALPAAADIITSADLQISGASFKVVNGTVTVQQGTPAIVQTSIGDLQNDQAPSFNDGTFATGELIGPGIVTPVPFITGRGYLVSDGEAELAQMARPRPGRATDGRELDGMVAA